MKDLLEFDMVAGLGYRSRIKAELRRYCFARGIGCQIEEVVPGWLQTGYRVSLHGPAQDLREAYAAVMYCALRANEK